MQCLSFFGWLQPRNRINKDHKEEWTFPAPAAAQWRLLAHLSLTAHPQEVKPKLYFHLTKNMCTEWLHTHQKDAGQKPPSQTQEHQRKAKHILSCPSIHQGKKRTFTAAQESTLDPWWATGTNLKPFQKSRQWASQTPEILDCWLN